jgi:hypothetical protein
VWKDRLRTFAFVTITLLSGAIAGTLLGLLNQALVEPYIDRAISVETQNAIKKGEVIYPVELQKYRLLQKAGEIAAGTILGTSLGALFGIVFVYLSYKARLSPPLACFILYCVHLIMIYQMPIKLQSDDWIHDLLTPK